MEKLESSKENLRIIAVEEHYLTPAFLQLPFMLPRFDQQFPQNLTKLNRKISEYLRKNVYYSFSGFNWTQTFLDLYLQVGADRIIYSGDYPWSTEDATVLNNLPISQ